MKFLDAYILARTKRKTRRIRMTLVIIVSSLLFAVLFFAVLTFNGVQRSGSRFQDYRYNGLHLTSATNTTPYSGNFDAIQREIHDQMEAELRTRKVKVTDEIRNNPEYAIEFGTRFAKRASEITRQQSVTFEQMVQQKYSPKATYHVQLLEAIAGAQFGDQNDPDPYLTVQQRQIETGVSDGKQNGGFQNMTTFYTVEEGMMQPLLQPGQSLAWQPGQPYPIVIPYDYAAQLSKASFAGLNGEQKIQTYQKILHTYTGKTFTYCYRNATAQGQLDSVLKYNHDAITDKDATTKPLAVQSCTGFDQAVLKKAGLLAAADPDHKPLFPQPAEPAPDTRTLTFKVVGFVPTTQFGPGSDIFSSLFTSVNSWPASLPIIMPAAVAAQDTFLRTAGPSQIVPDGGSLFFDFKTRAEQKHFIDAAGCKGDSCYNSAGDQWILAPFGSIKTALEGVLRKLVSIGKWVALGVAVLASILILLTISKLMSDNRREIAVFRALGARQRDIAQIYFTYGLMLACSALVVSVVLAVIGAMVFSAKFAGQFNAGLVQAVGAYDNPGQSTLLGVDPLGLGAVAALLLLSTLVGVAIPVLLSRRRNLVSIMREE